MIGYLISVAVWMVILFGVASLLVKKVVEDCLIDEDEFDEELELKDKVALVVGFVIISMTPIFRFLVCALLFYITMIWDDIEDV